MQIPYANLASASAVTTDANGWSVINLGAVKLYKKRFTFSKTAQGGGTDSSIFAGQALPVGFSTVGGFDFIDATFSVTGSGSAGIACTMLVATSATLLEAWARNNEAGAVTWSGFCDVTLVNF